MSFGDLLELRDLGDGSVGLFKAGQPLPYTLKLGKTGPLGGATNPTFATSSGFNNYIQGYILNTTNGISASADFVAYCSNGSDTHGWADMGMTSLAYADTVYTVTGPNEAYLFGSGPTGTTGTGNLVLATDSTGTANSIQFYIGGFTQIKAAWKMQITSTAVSVALPFFPVQAVTGSAPAYVKGGMYFDTTLNKLRIGGATAWETVTSA